MRSFAVLVLFVFSVAGRATAGIEPLGQKACDAQVAQVTIAASGEVEFSFVGERGFCPPRFYAEGELVKEYRYQYLALMGSDREVFRFAAAPGAEVRAANDECVWAVTPKEGETATVRGTLKPQPFLIP